MQAIHIQTSFFQIGIVFFIEVKWQCDVISIGKRVLSLSSETPLVRICASSKDFLFYFFPIIHIIVKRSCSSLEVSQGELQIQTHPPHLENVLWSIRLFTKFFNGVQSFFRMEIILDYGHWVDLARSHLCSAKSNQWPLSNMFYS